METKTRVLIADPNEDFRLLMSEVLSAEEDMEVAGCAADGLEALALVKELNVDVLLLELVLPKLDGLGVLRKLSDLPHAPTVLVLSGFVNSNVISEAAELGASYFFSKPCDTPELLQRDSVPTEWVLQNYDSSYKVIIVGDAAMNPYELRERHYNWGLGTYGNSGLEWLELFKKQYPYLIWLNPEPTPLESNYWNQTHYQLAKIFDMHQLTAAGLEAGMKRLMVRR